MLGSSQVDRIMNRLGVEAGPLGPQHLQDLMSAYVRAVPWESASRIAKRSICSSVEACARWPAEFWDDHLEYGTGGTCFESNYAFKCLLSVLGYDGYLTVSDMNGTPRSHAALVVRFGRALLLVDVGIPLHAPIQLNEMRANTQSSPFHDYTVTPLRRGVFEVSRDRHPTPALYTLYDKPLPDPIFRSILMRDYDPTHGLFLDCIIIHKVIDDVQYRFCSADSPSTIESFPGGRCEREVLERGTVDEVADRFKMDLGVLKRAWDCVVGPSGHP